MKRSLGVLETQSCKNGIHVICQSSCWYFTLLMPHWNCWRSIIWSNSPFASKLHTWNIFYYFGERRSLMQYFFLDLVTTSFELDKKKSVNPVLLNSWSQFWPGRMIALSFLMVLNSYHHVQIITINFSGNVIHSETRQHDNAMFYW